MFKSALTSASNLVPDKERIDNNKAKLSFKSDIAFFHLLEFFKLLPNCFDATSAAIPASAAVFCAFDPSRPKATLTSTLEKILFTPSINRFIPSSPSGLSHALDAADHATLIFFPISLTAKDADLIASVDSLASGDFIKDAVAVKILKYKVIDIGGGVRTLLTLNNINSKIDNSSFWKCKYAQLSCRLNIWKEIDAAKAE